MYNSFLGCIYYSGSTNGWDYYTSLFYILKVPLLMRQLILDQEMEKLVRQNLDGVTIRYQSSLHLGVETEGRTKY